ncbi:MAG: cellulose biosynthesis protein BcsS [Deltaproteobacteria bacterium]
MRGRERQQVRYGPCAAMVAAVIAAATTVTSSAGAGDDRPHWREVWKWRETWSGVDVARDNWLVYSGTTVAPFGHIHEPGLRVRASGGYGQYAYTGNRSIDASEHIQTFQAATYFGEVLVGYLESFGPLTAKAFAGASYLAHDIAPNDPDNQVTGNEIGFKGVVELWLDIGDIGFASLDATWNTAFETRSARSRVGLYVAPSLSAGFEAWLNLDAQSNCDLGWDDTAACHQDDETALLDYTRAGLFLRYVWDDGEISISGGVSGGSFQSAGDAAPEPYATLNWITQF